MRNALSFDVEEYFQVEAFASSVRPHDWPHFPSRVELSTRALLDLLDHHHASATFFVLGWVAERHPDLVRAIHARGHEVACHSYAHRLVYSMSPAAFRADVRRAKSAIEDAVAVKVAGYRAPTFSIIRESLWALEILSEEGFTYDSSIFPIHHDRYGIPEAPRFPHRVAFPSGGSILEFPITTLPVLGHRLPFSGGGYFRLAPYRLIRAGLQRVNHHERRPAIVYLHPWEMDPAQPRIAANLPTRVRHYVNLDRTVPKLQRLLADFAFSSVSDILRDQGLWDTDE